MGSGGPLPPSSPGSAPDSSWSVGRRKGTEPSRLNSTVWGISHQLVETDLGRLTTVAAASRTIAAQEGGKGNLILTTMPRTAGRRGVTEEGFELAFGVNYFAHFLLTSQLLEAKLPITRVINADSNAMTRRRSSTRAWPWERLGALWAGGSTPTPKLRWRQWRSSWQIVIRR